MNARLGGGVSFLAPAAGGFGSVGVSSGGGLGGWFDRFLWLSRPTGIGGVSALVSGVVSSVLAGVPRRGVAVGCAVGADALVVSSALALGASSRLRVFAAFGPVSPPASLPAARVYAPGASASVSSVSGVAGALVAGASVC